MVTKPKIMNQVTVNKSNIEIYYIRGVKYGGWADITIDEGQETNKDRTRYFGRISISSSHGNWSFFWGACGEPFKEFFASLDIHYAAGKFGCSNVLDFEETIKEWKRLVLSERREDSLTKEEAFDIWQEIKEIENDHPDLSGLEYMLCSRHNLMRFMDGMPHIGKKLDPSFVFFWENIRPHLLEAWKEETELVTV
jgi:hypothetical protein